MSAKAPTAGSGGQSGTVTVTLAPPSTQEQNSAPATLVLRAEEQEKHVKWDDTAVDNENLGRKSSKVCCQFHKKRRWDESSSESSSDEESASRKGKCSHEHNAAGKETASVDPPMPDQRDS